MSVPKLSASLEALVKDALGPVENEYGTYSSHTFSAVAQTLNEVGIKPRAMWTDVAFDPEKWERPINVEAIKVKSAITDGLGAYRWQAIIDGERARQQITDDYCDRQGTHSVNWDSLLSLQSSTTGRNNMLDKLDYARSVVQRWTIEQETPKATARATRRPRL